MQTPSSKHDLPSESHPLRTPMPPSPDTLAPATMLKTIVHFGAGSCVELDDYLATGADTIWLIEADPGIADALAARAQAHDQVQVHPLAVAKEGGEATLHRYNLPEANSLSQATGLHDLFPGLRLVEQLVVPAVAYSDLLEPLNLQTDSGDHLLVIELPGQELQALQALQQAGQLLAFQHIRLHCGREPLHADSTPAQTVVQWLQEQGYDLTSQDDEHDPDRPVWAFRRNPHLIELLALREQFQELSGRLAQSEEREGAQTAQIEQLQEAKGGAEQQLVEQQSRIRDLEQSLAESSDRLKKEVGAQRVHIEARRGLEKWLQEQQQALEKVTAERDQQAKRADEQTHQANELAESKTQAEKLADARAAELQKLAEARKALEQQCTEQQSRTQALEQSVAESRKRLEQEAAGHKEQAEARSGLEERLQEQQQAMEKLTAERDQQTKRADEQRKQAKELAEAKTRAENLAEERAAELQKLAEARKALEKQRTEQQSRIQVLEQRVAEAMKRLEQETAAHKEQAGARASLDEQIHEATVALETCTQERNQQAKRADQLAANIKAEAEVRQVLEERLNKVQADEGFYTRRHTMLQIDLDNLRERFAESERQRTQQEALLRKLTPRLAQAAEELKKLRIMPAPGPTALGEEAETPQIQPPRETDEPSEKKRKRKRKA